MFLRKLVEYFSRKFVLSLASLFGGFGLAWFGKDVSNLTELIAVVLGLYNGPNVLQDYIAYKKSKVTGATPEVPPTPSTE
jgi:hypothetical protein